MLTQKVFGNAQAASSPATKIRSELSRHIASRTAEEFAPSPDASAALSRQLRELEFKRQSGAVLTDEEKSLLRETDQLLQDIAKHNEQLKNLPQTQESLYDLNQSKHVPADDAEAQPPVIPQISDEEANRIIAGIDQQFEEKVMSRIRQQGGGSAAPAPRDQRNAPDPEPEAERGEQPKGRSLQEYLSVIKTPEHPVPFADEDSGFDLSKLVRRGN